MKTLLKKREPKRSEKKVKADIIDTGKIVREDIYEIIKGFVTRDEALVKLENFLLSLPEDVVAYKGNRYMGVKRVLSDIDSYMNDAKSWRNKATIYRRYQRL